MSDTNIQDKFREFLSMNEEITNLRQQVKKKKEQIDHLEKEIKDYMTHNNMDSISMKDGEIVLYSRKISQTFKKDTIVEKLTEELKDSQKAERLTQSIIQNKKYVVEEKIKAVIKKKK